ncbi:OsmC family protein [Spirosoma pollinicola]|uniref:Osmotically inducible protein OsmC n=1 Tax=Spirosoma pollinicola TaxID=2057025 RepID=A0A2K8YYP3_9BACT|nr:OsmC family protein [Spirosoma pollinicola]AUD02757.1 osmotically inducible protein OsmC [Spirosoma pollinicola]
MEPIYYEVNLGWQHDRMGQLSSPALTTTIEVATPPDFPKGMAGIWSPEHLMVAAVSSCFMTSFLAISENSQLAFETFTCRAVGKLEKIDNVLMVAEITLFPEVVIVQESDMDKANRVLLKSEKVCLISNSIRSKVSMQPTIQVEVQA